ncbi:heparan-sulfate 6-O-sulfotransferase 3-B-like isoform X2 [Convolutriloba macropyga]|uniref:heparan-sulfate 6-O-sulfotransferase 3-B-like isoform X2 n=1 Tax=Convolutriloba macropyga TaxID=536237 RepID=UPI003F51C727
MQSIYIRMTPPLLTLVTSKTAYTVGSISVILFTVSYYFSFPPVVRNRCEHIRSEFKYKHESYDTTFPLDSPKFVTGPLDDNPKLDTIAVGDHRRLPGAAVPSLILPPSQLYGDRVGNVRVPEKVLGTLPKSKPAVSGDPVVAFDKTWIENNKPQFNIYHNDVIVFLHIQKTGGTQFDEFLTHQVKGAECVCTGYKQCICNRPESITSNEAKYDQDDYDYNYDYKKDREESSEGKEREGEEEDNTWLFSRSSNHRWGCGIHADWTELTACVPSLLNTQETINPHRRFFYVTMLRDPVERVVSEWLHVRRGATWKSSRHMCNGQQHHHAQQPCYKGDSWKGVELNDFLSCKSNLAINRQTRMLADLSLVNCYQFLELQRRLTKNNSESISEALHLLETKMLISAKNNLQKLASFGILGRNEESLKLLARSLGLEFKSGRFRSRGSKSENVQLPESMKSQIESVNNLDKELFKHATEVFNKRLKLL